MIQLKEVSKIYTRGRTLYHAGVSDITLSLTAQRISVLQGPSGSGKTTLLSLIGCMVRPTTGRIFFYNKEVSSLPERFLSNLRRRQVGFVFQNFNLIRGISVLENVLLPALPLGHPLKGLHERVYELLAHLEIENLARRNVEQLSAGEQQRTAIARALINQPALLLADEPTAHLDSELSHQFMTIVAGLKCQGTTVVMASHDPLICSHPAVDLVVMMRDGRIQESRPSQ